MLRKLQTAAACMYIYTYVMYNVHAQVYVRVCFLLFLFYFAFRDRVNNIIVVHRRRDALLTSATRPVPVLVLIIIICEVLYALRQPFPFSQTAACLQVIILDYLLLRFLST